MANKKITNSHVEDVYSKFKSYFFSNKDDFLNKKSAHIVEDIKKLINNENKLDWNDTSLSDYINDLIYMLKGESFARTINKYAEEYFIANICKDFDPTICNNAKDSLRKHKEYYKNITGKGNQKYTKEKFNIHPQNIYNKVEFKKDNSKIKNIILYGSPGVGKTYNIKKLISFIESEVLEKEIFETIKENELNDGVDANRIVDNILNRVKFITFHQSFGYEDFIEGFRPNENGDIKLQDGIFKTICDDANNDRENNYYLIIDEINRGNISKIFGELITLIEEDKRDTLEVTLPYSKKPFKIPSNLYIIGTMNSTDKSIALIDIALRRRFTFLKMEPNLELVDNEKAKRIMEQLNEKITETLGADYVLGHSYFMRIENDDDLDFVLEYKIKPLLEEYFYGDESGLTNILEIINE